MDLYEAIKLRRSVRKYRKTPVPQDKILRIWEAVRWAPSACNLQPWKFLIVDSPEKRAKLKGIVQDWAMEAPILIVALGNKEIAWRRDNESVHSIDVAIAVEHLVLAATAEGLGTCWICAFDRKRLSSALGIKPQWDPVAIIPLGYSADDSPRSTRKEIAEIVRIV
ncbi:MAG: nitroreductase family protein [Verrucomicrobiae bacterium]|nr:nitroreductase family protein [Verrucomicrobiae bacterium]